MVAEVSRPPSDNVSNSLSGTDWSERQHAKNSLTAQFPSSIRESVADVDKIIHKADDAIARRREELRNLQLQRQLRMAPTNGLADNRSTAVNTTIGRSAQLLARAQAVVPGLNPSMTNAIAKEASMGTSSDYHTRSIDSSNVSSAAKSSLPGKITLTRSALIAKAEAAVASASMHLEGRHLQKTSHATGDIHVPKDSLEIESSPLSNALGASIQHTLEPAVASSTSSSIETNPLVLNDDHKLDIINTMNVSSPPTSSQESLSARSKKFVDTPIDRDLLRASDHFYNEEILYNTHPVMDAVPFTPNESFFISQSSKKELLEAMRDAASTPPIENENNSHILLSDVNKNNLSQERVESLPVPAPLQPSSTPTLRMVQELNRIQQEYTSVMKRNLQLEKELKHLRNVVIEEDRKDGPSSVSLPPAHSFVYESDDSSSLINRQLFLQHFLSDLVGKATVQGDAAAIQWAQSQISLPASMEKWMKQYNNPSSIPSSSSVVGISSPNRLRGRAMGSPTKHSSSSRNRMKSPQPKGRQRTTWKEYMDDGETDTAMRALQAVSIEYTSDLATYVIRKPHGGNTSLICKTSDDDFLGQVNWITTVHEYTQRSTVDDPSTLEVMAYIHDDSSILFVQGDCYTKHGSKCIGDENLYEWKVYENFNSDDLLGSVVYIDVHGNEQEYLLDVILNEAYDIRERYCASVLSAAAALSASKTNSIMQHRVTPTLSLMEEREINVPVSQESVQSLSLDNERDSASAEPPLNVATGNKYDSSETLSSIPENFLAPVISNDATDQGGSKESETAHLPPSTHSPTPSIVTQPKIHNHPAETNRISPPLVSKVERPRTHPVFTQNKSGTVSFISSFIIFMITLPFRILLFFFIRLPWMIFKTLICSLLLFGIFSLLWLCLSDDFGAMTLGAGVNNRFVPSSFFL